MMIFKRFAVVALLCALCIPGYFVDAGTQVDASKNSPARPGKVIRDPKEALRVEDMTEAELRERLAEYEAGKRDYRDGFILLNQLRFNHKARRETASSEFQRISEKRKELLQSHPELGSLQDFQLSDRLRYNKMAAGERARLEGEAREWEPSDSKLLRVLKSNDRAVAVYQYRLEFYELSSEVTLAKGKNTDRLRFHKNGREISPQSLRPRKKMTFRTRFDIRPNYPDDIPGRFLVCTNPVARYTPVSPSERKLMATKGFTHGMPWKKRRGKYKQFCGIVSDSGKVLFKFRFSESVPESVMAPLKIAPDGSWAAVMIGEVVGGEDSPGIGKPREVWIWRDSGEVEKYPATDDKPIVRELLQFFPKPK